MGTALFGTSNQWWVFLFMVYGGVALGLLYHLLAIIRLLLGLKGLFIALFDLAYWFMVVIIAFGLLYIAEQGEFHVFHVLGISLGSLLYALGPGRLLNNGERWIARKWHAFTDRFKKTALHRFLTR